MSILLPEAHLVNDSLSFEAKNYILSSLKAASGTLAQASGSVDDWLQSYVISKKSSTEVDIDEEMSRHFTYHVTSLDDEFILLELLTEIKANNAKEYCLNAEMASLQTLDIFNSLCDTSEIPAELVSMNLSSNNLTDVQFIDNGIITQVETLKYLSLASNNIIFATNITFNCTRNLLYLDLSYTDELQLTAGCFMFLNCLQKLVLDGINLSITHDTTNSLSYFIGLINLTELSLKENQISEKDALNGLIMIFNNHEFYRLKKIFLAENPLPLSKYKAALGSAISTLRFVDSQQVNAESVNDTPYHVLEHNRSNQSNNISIGEYHDNKGLDSMEAEYLAALKGERDNTVVN